MDCRGVLFTVLLLVLLQETVARAIQLKETKLFREKQSGIVKSNVNLNRALWTEAGIDHLSHKASRDINNKAEITARRVDALVKRGQERDEVEEKLPVGVFKRMLEKICSTENGVLLEGICRKQKLFKKGWGNPSSIPWIY